MSSTHNDQFYRMGLYGRRRKVARKVKEVSKAWRDIRKVDEYLCKLTREEIAKAASEGLNPAELARLTGGTKDWIEECILDWYRQDLPSTY